MLQALLWPESAGATASTSRSVDQRERLMSQVSKAIVPISDRCFAPTQSFQLQPNNGPAICELTITRFTLRSP